MVRKMVSVNNSPSYWTPFQASYKQTDVYIFGNTYIESIIVELLLLQENSDKILL